MKINGIRATRINAKSTFIRCLSGIYPGHAARMNCPDKGGFLGGTPFIRPFGASGFGGDLMTKQIRQNAMTGSFTAPVPARQKLVRHGDRPFDEAIRRMDRKWGVDRLPETRQPGNG